MAQAKLFALLCVRPTCERLEVQSRPFTTIVVVKDWQQMNVSRRKRRKCRNPVPICVIRKNKFRQPKESVHSLYWCQLVKQRRKVFDFVVKDASQHRPHLYGYFVRCASDTSASLLSYCLLHFLLPSTLHNFVPLHSVVNGNPDHWKPK